MTYFIYVLSKLDRSGKLTAMLTREKSCAIGTHRLSGRVFSASNLIFSTSVHRQVGRSFYQFRQLYFPLPRTKSRGIFIRLFRRNRSLSLHSLC
jgi:hypothetical protein